MGVLELLLMPSRSESCSESCVCIWMCVYKGADVGMGVLELLPMPSRSESCSESVCGIGCLVCI